MLAGTTLTLSLTMYALPEMEEANFAFLTALQERLHAGGVDMASAALDSGDESLPGRIQPVFTQICGYPLFKQYRGQYRMLATPHYAVPGCVGSHHRAFFVVRADDPAEDLSDLRGRVFGCNSLLSNTGMNLPRLSLARLAGGRAFFSSVVITGAHTASLERLDEGSIDLCSVDCVTWGLFKKLRPVAAERYRVLAETEASPSLPFVTSIRTSESDTAAIVQALHAVLKDPEIAHICDMLALTGLTAPDVTAYERLAGYERESNALGFPDIR